MWNGKCVMGSVEINEDQYQYLGRRRYVTEPFKFTTKQLI